MKAQLPPGEADCTVCAQRLANVNVLIYEGRSKNFATWL